MSLSPPRAVAECAPVGQELVPFHQHFAAPVCGLDLVVDRVVRVPMGNGSAMIYRNVLHRFTFFVTDAAKFFKDLG